MICRGVKLYFPSGLIIVWSVETTRHSSKVNVKRIILAWMLYEMYMNGRVYVEMSLEMAYVYVKSQRWPKILSGHTWYMVKVRFQIYRDCGKAYYYIMFTYCNIDFKIIHRFREQEQTWIPYIIILGARWE